MNPYQGLHELAKSKFLPFQLASAQRRALATQRSTGSSVAASVAGGCMVEVNATQTSNP
jgi:hypothetical protein